MDKKQGQDVNAACYVILVGDGSPETSGVGTVSKGIHLGQDLNLKDQEDEYRITRELPSINYIASI